MRGARRLLAAVLACLALAGCTQAPRPRAAPRATTRLQYRVQLDGALRAMTVHVCFEGTLAGGLIPGHADAFARLRTASWTGPGRVELRAQKGMLQVPTELHQGCLRYELDLYEGGALSSLVQRVGDQLITSVPAWLWRPRMRAEALEAELRFELPEGMRASVAWQRRGDAYALGASALAFDSYAAFGRFSIVEVERSGVTAHAALLGDTAMDRQEVQRWLDAALHIAAQSDGHFPGATLQVLWAPSGFGAEPFGNVTRGGGASVLLLVPPALGPADLQKDWVLPHELSHLLLPFVTREDAWLSEGLATYYQEILRARAGILSIAEALSNVASALRSAQREGTGRTLCEESRSMHRTHAYRAVYWGGAGHWLLADLALRRSTRGKRTLDSLLSILRRSARTSPAYRAEEILSWLDRESGTTLFSQLRAECQSAPFPDFERALEQLGVLPDGSLDDDPEHTALRSALLASQAPK